MQRLPADRQRGAAASRDVDAVAVDRALIRAAAGRVVGALPVAMAISAAIELPVVAATMLLPEWWLFLGWPAAWTLAAGAVLLAGPGDAGDIVAALRGASRRRTDLLQVGALEVLGIVGFTLPPLLLWLVGLGAFGAYLTALALIVSGSRLALAVPALVLRDIAPLDALELSWDLVDGAAVEVGTLFAVAGALSFAPAAGVGLLALALGWPVFVVVGAIGIAVAVAGPLLPLAFGEALDVIERRRRALDPRFGRP